MVCEKLLKNVLLMYCRKNKEIWLNCDFFFKKNWNKVSKNVIKIRE